MAEALPRRSVTHFMLPLADIMALLFSLFLLLPHLEPQPGPQTAQAVTPGNLWTPAEQQRLNEELTRLRRLAQLPMGKRLYTVVLEIDRNTGDLLLQRGKELMRLSSQNLDDLVREHRAEARIGDRQLFYFVRQPSPGPGTAHPTRADINQYRQWFEERKVDYQIELPRG